LQPPGEGGTLQACALCGNHELYKKKDFPHGLGLAILTLACLATIVPYLLYMQWLVWTILLGVLGFDIALYLLVGDVVVCYRCQAHYRGYPPRPAGSDFPPHELGIAERFHQERIRLEQLRATRKPPVT
jgi:hypothetical protein